VVCVNKFRIDPLKLVNGERMLQLTEAEYGTLLATKPEP